MSLEESDLLIEEQFDLINMLQLYKVNNGAAASQKQQGNKT